MPIPFDKIRPQREGERSPLYLALLIRHVAGEEARSRATKGDPEPEPVVRVHISSPMLKGDRFTGDEGFEGISEKGRRIVKLLVASAETYLAMPHIIDDFRIHPERREWCDKHVRPLGADAVAFVKKNPLSMNALLALSTGFRLAATEVGGLSCPEARFIRDVSERIGERDGLPDIVGRFGGIDPVTGREKSYEYDELPLAEKREIAKAYERACRGLLLAIAGSIGKKRDLYDPRLEESAGRE